MTSSNNSNTSNEKLKAADFDTNLGVLQNTISSYTGCRRGERAVEIKRVIKWFSTCKEMEMLRKNVKREEHRQEVLDYAKSVIDSYDHQEATKEKEEMQIEDAPKHAEVDAQIQESIEAGEWNPEAYVPKANPYMGMSAKELTKSVEGTLKKLDKVMDRKKELNRRAHASLAQELRWAWDDRNLNYDGTEEQDEFKIFMNSQNYIYGIDSFSLLEKTFSRSDFKGCLLDFSNLLRRED
jgi:hypothetical protein